MFQDLTSGVADPADVIHDLQVVCRTREAVLDAIELLTDHTVRDVAEAVLDAGTPTRDQVADAVARLVRTPQGVPA